jgi:hypothetical protein
MMRPKGRRKGFTKLAVEILRNDPSRSWTAKELAEEGLRRDPTLSVARNPVQSLAHTFDKQAVHYKVLPEIAVVGSDPRRFRWQGGNGRGGRDSSEPPSGLSIPPSSAREYVTVTVGESQFRGPVTAENLDTAIGILQRTKENL